MANFIEIVLRLIIAAVFAAAGIAKLRDHHGTIRMLMGFGLAERLARPSGAALPVLELAVAVALLLPVSARYGALAALALVMMFSAAMVWNLARGRRPDCQCFGQAHATPIGWQPLARNAGLALAAAVVLWMPADAVGHTTGALLAVAVGTVIVALGYWIARLTSRVRMLEQRAAGSPVAAPGDVAASDASTPALSRGRALGSVAPEFSLINLDGVRVSLGTLLSRGKPVLLVFTDPGCGPCARLLPDIGARHDRLGPFVTIAAVSRGAADAQALVAGVPHLLVQRDREVMNDYQVAGTPTAVLINADGTIGSPLAPGELNIARLLDELERQTTADAAAPFTTDGLTPAAASEPVTSLDSPAKADCVHDELLPDGSVVLYNACRRQALTLNATGALVWECCDGSHRVDAIAGVVRDVFPAAPDAVRDVVALLQQLRDAGMVTLTAGAPALDPPATAGLSLATAE
jgi:uncharacterized membrane protein YphA (DoxX/SURF4 family)